MPEHEEIVISMKPPQSSCAKCLVKGGPEGHLVIHCYPNFITQFWAHIADENGNYLQACTWGLILKFFATHETFVVALSLTTQILDILDNSG